MFSRTHITIRQLAPAVRRMSTQPPAGKAAKGPQNNTAKNVVTALALLGFVGGVYYTAIAKMRQTDDLTTIIEDEAKKAKSSASGAINDAKKNAEGLFSDAKKSVEGAVKDATKK